MPLPWVLSLASSATVFSDCSRRFSLIIPCSSRVSRSIRAMRSLSRSRWLLARSSSRLLPASSWRSSWFCAVSAACSASSSLRCSAPSGLPSFLPALSTVPISSRRVWLLLMSAWARSGRVCAVRICPLASASCFCQSASWLLCWFSSISSWVAL
ncbi:hypothetical protein D3C76_892620 [compost metagenome]